MTARHEAMRNFGPGILGGTTTGDWWRILRENRFEVSPRYWPRALGISLLGLVNTFNGRREIRRHGAAVRATPVAPPVFVLGLWLGGTTYLHTLMTRDTRFAYPDLYEALNPDTFLGGKRIGAPLLDQMVTRRRLMDRMRQGAWEPVEEDIALAAHGMSSMLGLVFPRYRDRHWRWVTMDGLTDDELTRWRGAYQDFVQRLSYAKGRRLVLKSPANTARIRHILEMYPDAVFVTVHRHPADVLRSTLHALNTTSPWWRLHGGEFDLDWVIRSYGEVVRAYFRDRALVPASRLCEVAYADLVRDPVGEVARVYHELDLPDYSFASEAVAAHAKEVRGHERVEYKPLPAGVEERLNSAWKPAFEGWGYQI